MTTSCIVRFGLFALAIKNTAVFDASGIEEQPFSSTSDLKKGNTVAAPYITLEKNYWKLDGNYKFMPTTNPLVGIMSSNQSDASGVFTVPPELLITFTSVQSTDGLALRFGEYSGDWADDINVKFYDASGTLIRSDDYAPSGAIFSTGQAVSSFKSILIRFDGTNKPYRFLRLAGLDFGSIIEFTAADIMTASAIQQTNFLSTELPIDTFEMSLYSSDAAFSIINPTGAYASLKELQPLDVLENVDGKIIFIGTYYLKTWKNRSQTSVNFRCIDAIGVMDSISEDYVGGMYARESAATVLDALFDSAGLSYELDEYFADATISGWLPVMNHREALRHIAFALGAYVTCARANAVQIKRASLVSEIVTPDFLVPQSMQGLNQELTLKPLVTGVKIYSHDYSEGTDSLDAFRGFMAVGSQRITFDQPLHHLRAVGANITSSGANYAVLEAVTAGQVVLTGLAYDETQQKCLIYTDNLDPSVKQNVVVILDETLVNRENLQALTERAYAYYQQRHNQTAKLIKPLMQVGETVDYEALYSQTLTGMVESMEMDLAGGFIAQTTIVGVAA